MRAAIPCVRELFVSGRNRSYFDERLAELFFCAGSGKFLNIRGRFGAELRYEMENIFRLIRFTEDRNPARLGGIAIRHNNAVFHDGIFPLGSRALRQQLIVVF